MKKFLICFCIIFLQTALTKVSAQPPQSPDDGDRQKWMTELRNYKHDFLVKELEIDEDQQKQFFSEYDSMEDRINELNMQTRNLEQKVLADPNASDVEIEAAARALFELKGEESKIELEYYDKFKEILSPKQLIRIKNAERKFTQRLMQHHRRLRGADGPRKKQ